MDKILIVDNSSRDAVRLQQFLADEGLVVEVCHSGVDGERALKQSAGGFTAAFIVWDLAGSVSGFDLLNDCKRLWPEMPVVVMSDAIDAAMATRAYVLGAREFLEKPLDSTRLLSCVRALRAERDPLTPLVMKLRERVFGESPAILATLSQVAKAIPHPSLRVLITGESGTGKELVARAIHDFGAARDQRFVAVNVTAIPTTLAESILFGHEKGSFTDAKELRIGVFEEAGNGTVFLDEIGDLEAALQTKLLRVIEANEFRRLGGKEPIKFRARLVSATNRDLAEDASRGTFRSDLYYRIAEATIRIPPLRERKKDVDMLLRRFLDRYRGNRNVTFARETLAILRSYPFYGNVRELKNLVKAALVECEGDVLLPQHLPLEDMNSLLHTVQHAGGNESKVLDIFPPDSWVRVLMESLGRALSAGLTRHPYKEVRSLFIREFDRAYLKHKLDDSRHNVTQAARQSGVDVKTFRTRWRESGLPPLEHDRERANDHQDAEDTDR
jgi:DNA-binding NtrC family response regulator